ncbi:hypothetical protein HNR33_002951 [Brassicibacter mesophilus]
MLAVFVFGMAVGVFIVALALNIHADFIDRE